MLDKPIFQIAIKHYLLFIFLFLLVHTGKAQLMNHYWVHNFNSTSSLLGGAVIAGDAANTAIFYNPATIGEIQSGNNLSLAANLFSWNFYNFDNALVGRKKLTDDQQKYKLKSVLSKYEKSQNYERCISLRNKINSL